MKGERKEVMQKLADWVIRTVNRKELATPEEIEALPKVAKVFLENCFPVAQFKEKTVAGTTTDSVDSKELVKSLDEISKSNVRRSL